MKLFLDANVTASANQLSKLTSLNIFQKFALDYLQDYAKAE